MPRNVSLALLCVVVLSGCPSGCQENGLTGPSAIPDSNTAYVAVIPEWSPHLGVHGFASHTDVQQSYLLPLFRSGAVRDIRLDMDEVGGPAFADFALQNGVKDVLGIFPNEHLLQSDVWGRLASKMSANPGVKYWEIGNELDNFTDIDIRRYLPVFLSLHERAHEEFPQNTLIPQAPVGGGSGAERIRDMLDGGLLELANRGLLPVLSVHYYTTGSIFLYDLKRQIQRLPGSTQVWVTETGSEYPDRHIEYVRTQYPRLRSQLRATRIYWYVFSGCNGYSLVAGLPDRCALEKPELSPLYQALRGGAP